jgi:hypothetical protein
MRVAAHSAVHDGEPCLPPEPIMTDNQRSVIGEITHGLTNAEKQASWRDRNLKNEKTAPSCALSSFSTPAPGRHPPW